ncbi:hypothetical protein SH584_08775 [Sphingomonas sp. LY29]|uniref:hypothetical protein n=1 Tax=Sphingomonas sp. LY29 TaxID=3095341 RepID=UPI002D77A779|nr:hypothetical protein [Sphingomonas sp. LY29]WRP25141.1 hypothetical protein SH584_08775 [Sphingomonas sp. LY29]
MEAEYVNTEQANDVVARRTPRTDGSGVTGALPAGGGYGMNYGNDYGGAGVPLPPSVHDAVSTSQATSPDITYHPPVGAKAKASNWTGRRTLTEQVHIVRTFAPLAITAVDELADAIERHQGNDPAYADALQVLKELHHALGELIAQAERGRGMKALLRSFEQRKGKLRDLITENGQLLAFEPLRAVAAAQALEFVSYAFGVSDMKADATLTAAIYCALLGREAYGRHKGK